MDSRKKLYFMFAVQSFKTSDPELARRNAENVIDNIESQEELDFVKSLLTEDEVKRLEGVEQ